MMTGRICYCTCTSSPIAPSAWWRVPHARAGAGRDATAHALARAADGRGGTRAMGRLASALGVAAACGLAVTAASLPGAAAEFELEIPHGSEPKCITEDLVDGTLVLASYKVVEDVSASSNGARGQLCARARARAGTRVHARPGAQSAPHARARARPRARLRARPSARTRSIRRADDPRPPACARTPALTLEGGTPCGPPPRRERA